MDSRPGFLEVESRHRTNSRLPDLCRGGARADPSGALAPIARQAALSAPGTVGRMRAQLNRSMRSEPFDAVVCSLVLCSVDKSDAVCAAIVFVAPSGGELRLSRAHRQSGWHAQRSA